MSQSDVIVQSGQSINALLAVQYDIGNSTVFDTIQILQSPDDICDLINCSMMINADDQLLGLDSIGTLLLAQQGIMSNGTIDGRDFEFYAGDFVLLEPGFEIMKGNTLIIEIDDCQQMVQAMLQDERRLKIYQEVKSAITPMQEALIMRGKD